MSKRAISCVKKRKTKKTFGSVPVQKNWTDLQRQIINRLLTYCPN